MSLNDPMHHAPNREEEFHPRLIVWQITGNPQYDERASGAAGEELSPNERHLVLEGIARTAKPIVVLTGGGLPQRRDVFELVQYGVALGLKMIVEARPSDLTADTMRRYAAFGPKVFRVIIDDAVEPGVDTRFAESTEFRKLEETISALRSAGFEIHLSMGTDRPDVRRLAIRHDYAFRRSANGFYCHLAIPSPDGDGEAWPDHEDEIDAYIDAVANLKQYCPTNMFYLSPQCVKYGFRHAGEEAGENPEDRENGNAEWRHWCLAGRSFAFITSDGVVRVCSQLPVENGDLRAARFDFKSVWENDETFQRLRDCARTCSQTRDMLKPDGQPQAQRRTK